MIRLFYIMSPKSGHITVSFNLRLLCLPTLKPHNLYCNHQVKSIVKVIWRQVGQISPVVMHEHAPSQREGEEITNIIAIVLLIYVMLVLIWGLNLPC